MGRGQYRHLMTNKASNGVEKSEVPVGRRGGRGYDGRTSRVTAVVAEDERKRTVVMAPSAGRGLLERKHFERQMGCMGGFLNLFDRHQILARKRLLPPPMVSMLLPQRCKFWLPFFFCLLSVPFRDGGF